MIFTATCRKSPRDRYVSPPRPASCPGGNRISTEVLGPGLRLILCSLYTGRINSAGFARIDRRAKGLGWSFAAIATWHFGYLIPGAANALFPPLRLRNGFFMKTDVFRGYRTTNKEYSVVRMDVDNKRRVAYRTSHFCELLCRTTGDETFTNTIDFKIAIHACRLTT